MYYTKLKKKYPVMWDNVYNSMIDTLLTTMKQADIDLYLSGYKKNRLNTIAHNAAFLACHEHHDMIKGNK